MRSEAWKTRRVLRAGETISASDLRHPVVVNKGQTVTMTFAAPGVDLTAMGRAMSEGGVGDTVTVQNPASFRMVTAIVTAAGTVRATGPATPRPRSRPADRIFHAQVPVQAFHRRAVRQCPVRRPGGLLRRGSPGKYRRGTQAAAGGQSADTQLVAAIPQPPPITHAGNSLWQPGAHSFFHDPRATHVGDVITVNVTVADAAKLSNTTSRSRTNSDDANLTNFFGLESALPKSIDPANVVKMGSDNSNVGAGSIDRSESINMTLAALVAQVLPNGNLVISGRQQVRVNNEMRDMQGLRHRPHRRHHR